MPSGNNVVEHLGRVDAITNNDIRVVITSQSACESCHARGACPASESKEKFIVVTIPNHNFIVGEPVKVLLKESLGFRALFLGYVLPLLVVLTTLFTLSAAGMSEKDAGLLSLAVLAPYYLGLYIFRKKIARKFEFGIEKIS
ncbi:MAG TPA: SoxR reducing system RseC family protein [Tenuifilaceae bacterium]|nr:SoxR reducing system RseC family protein [Tenuifilaceae bacterium]